MHIPLEIACDSFAPLSPVPNRRKPADPRDNRPEPRGPEPCPLSGTELRQLVLDVLG